MSDTPETPMPEEKPSPAYLLSLTVENFRCFGEAQTLDLSDGNGKPAMWNVILGENGVGKTTLLILLRSVEFVNVEDELVWKYSPVIDSLKWWIMNAKNFKNDRRVESAMFDKYYDDVNHDKYSKMIIGGFIVNISDGKTRLGEFYAGKTPIGYGYKVPESNIINGDSLFILDYSSSRLMDDRALTEKNENVSFLLSPLTPLPNAEDWLIQADYAVLKNHENKFMKQRLDLIHKMLCKILPDVEAFGFEILSGTSMTPVVKAKTPYGVVSLKDLSFGYQSTLAWVVDFASKLMDRYPESENPFEKPAICLVDEIDLHMHPRWQKELVKKLRDIFKGTQFIVTAHSPLIVQADPDANLALLKREGDHVVIKNDVDEIKNWRIEQILASELFAGAGSEYRDLVNPPHIATLLDRRRELLGKPELTDVDRAEVAEIDAKLDKLPTAERPEDQRALELIREAAALLATDDGK